MLVGISSGATPRRDPPEARRGRPRQAHPRLQLRYRRALSLGAGFPARGMRVEIGDWGRDGRDQPPTPNSQSAQNMTASPSSPRSRRRGHSHALGRGVRRQGGAARAGRPAGRRPQLGRRRGPRELRPRPAAARLGLSPRRRGMARRRPRTGRRRGVRVQNLPSVLRWNADKAYLGRFAERGAPVVPTRYVDRLDEAALAAAAAEFGTDQPDRQAPGLRLGLADDPLVAGRAARRRPDRPGDDPALPPVDRAGRRDLPDLPRSPVQPRHRQEAEAGRFPGPARMGRPDRAAPARRRRAAPRRRRSWRGSTSPCSTPGSTWSAASTARRC